MNVIIGIDPGVHTGVAVYINGKLTYMATPAMPILAAIDLVLSYQTALYEREMDGKSGSLLVIFEDARMIGGIGGARRGSKADTARLRGAGSVQRDCGIWDEFLTKHQIEHRKISPRQKGAKLSAEKFKSVTGWTAATNQHSRDAAMLVWPYRGLKR